MYTTWYYIKWGRNILYAHGISLLTSLVNKINIAKERLKYQQRVIFRNEMWKKASPKTSFGNPCSSTFKPFKMHSLADPNNPITNQTHSAMIDISDSSLPIRNIAQDYLPS